MKHPFQFQNLPPEFTAVVSLLVILPDPFLCIYLYVIYTNKHTILGCVFIFADK